MSDLQDQIRRLTANRHSAEARALFLTLIKYVDHRTKAVARNTCSDVMMPSDLEDVVSDVMLQLMSGTLAQFRGQTLPELFAFVRTISDRRLWRVARQRLRERKTIEAMGFEVTTQRTKAPDENVVIVPDVPLSAQDEEYLQALLRAGSKANFARQSSLSRAAVTQRVQRIRTRIAALAPQQRMAVDAWLHHTAREVLEEEATSTAAAASAVVS
jgi:hypothetical protein